MRLMYNRKNNFDFVKQDYENYLFLLYINLTASMYKHSNFDHFSLF